MTARRNLIVMSRVTSPGKLPWFLAGVAAAAVAIGVGVIGQ